MALERVHIEKVIEKGEKERGKRNGKLQKPLTVDQTSNWKKIKIFMEKLLELNPMQNEECREAERESSVTQRM